VSALIVVCGTHTLQTEKDTAAIGLLIEGCLKSNCHIAAVGKTISRATFGPKQGKGKGKTTIEANNQEKIWNTT